MHLSQKISWKKIIEGTSYAFCVIMVVYQVSNPVVGYFTDNLTYISTSTRPIQPEDLPKVIMCPTPGWNMELLNEAGYKDQWNLHIGNVECYSDDKAGYQNNSDCPPSWNGKYGNVTYQQLGLVNFTDVVKSPGIWFLDDNMEWEEEKIQDVEAIFLQEGNCFFFDLDKYVNETDIHNFQTFIFHLTLNKTKAETITFHLVDPNKFYFMNGYSDPFSHYIDYETSDTYVKEFRVKISVQRNLENDPKVNCTVYGKGKEFESYGQCRQEEARSHTKSLIGCIPPEMSYKNESSYIKCSGKQKSIMKYIRGLRRDKIKSKCKKSCTTINFKSALIRHYKDEDWGSSLWINVDSIITEDQSVFTITPLSILEALGSSVGLWLGIAIIHVAKEIFRAMGILKEKTNEIWSNGDKIKRNQIQSKDEYNLKTNIDDSEI